MQTEYKASSGVIHWIDLDRFSIEPDSGKHSRIETLQWSARHRRGTSKLLQSMSAIPTSLITPLTPLRRLGALDPWRGSMSGLHKVRICCCRPYRKSRMQTWHLLAVQSATRPYIRSSWTVNPACAPLQAMMEERYTAYMGISSNITIIGADLYIRRQKDWH